MMNVVPLDPDLPRQRRSVRSGLIYSFLSVALILFILGALPQVDWLLSALDQALRSHNDAIAAVIFQVLPFAVVGLAGFGLVYKFLGYLNKQKRSA